MQIHEAIGIPIQVFLMLFKVTKTKIIWHLHINWFLFKKGDAVDCQVGQISHYFLSLPPNALFREGTLELDKW